MTGIPIFFCEPTGERLFYKRVKCAACGHVMADQSTEKEYEGGDWDPQPFACHQCGEEVRYNTRGFNRQWRRSDTGETLYDPLPAGAVYAFKGWSWDDGGPYNWRQSKRADGKEYFVTRFNEQDNRVLACVCPDGHHWIIDARASNCTMKDDDDHWCWIRHGRPEDGTLHVDKNGRTCAAGAGSIATGKWHGFLHSGHLTEC